MLARALKGNHLVRNSALLKLSSLAIAAALITSGCAAGELGESVAQAQDAPTASASASAKPSASPSAQDATGAPDAAAGAMEGEQESDASDSASMGNNAANENATDATKKPGTPSSKTNVTPGQPVKEGAGTAPGSPSATATSKAPGAPAATPSRTQDSSTPGVTPQAASNPQVAPPAVAPPVTNTPPVVTPPAAVKPSPPPVIVPPAPVTPPAPPVPADPCANYGPLSGSIWSNQGRASDCHVAQSNSQAISEINSARAARGLPAFRTDLTGCQSNATKRATGGSSSNTPAWQIITSHPTAAFWGDVEGWGASFTPYSPGGGGILQVFACA